VVNLGIEPLYTQGNIPRHILNTRQCVRVCVRERENLDPVQHVKHVPGIP